MIKEITRQELNPMLDALVRGKIAAVEFGNQQEENATKILRIVTVKSMAGNRFAIKFLRNNVETSSGVYLSDCDKDDLVERLNEIFYDYEDIPNCKFYKVVTAS